jgi:hypothetical protein
VAIERHTGKDSKGYKDCKLSMQERNWATIKKNETIRIRGNAGGDMGLIIVESVRLGGLEASEARKTIKQFERQPPIFFSMGRSCFEEKQRGTTGVLMGGLKSLTPSTPRMHRTAEGGLVPRKNEAERMEAGMREVGW